MLIGRRLAPPSTGDAAAGKSCGTGVDNATYGEKTDGDATKTGVTTTSAADEQDLELLKDMLKPINMLRDSEESTAASAADATCKQEKLSEAEVKQAKSDSISRDPTPFLKHIQEVLIDLTAMHTKATIVESSETPARWLSSRSSGY